MFHHHGMYFPPSIDSGISPPCGNEMHRKSLAAVAYFGGRKTRPKSYFDFLQSCRGITTSEAANLSSPRLRSRRPAAGYLTPREVARRWRIHVDKILVFIRAGELRAFNVASKASRRPRYLVPEEAVREFEAARAACPGGSASAAPAKRRARKPAPAAVRRYF